MHYAAGSDIEESPRRNKIIRWLMSKRTNKTDTRCNGDAKRELEEDHDCEEDMRPKGYTAKQEV